MERNVRGDRAGSAAAEQRAGVGGRAVASSPPAIDDEAPVAPADLGGVGDDLVFPEELPYEDPRDYWEEDPAIEEAWRQRRLRRRGVQAFGWLLLAIAAAGTFRLLERADARDAIGSWATMGQIGETARPSGDSIE